jgi:hypothetical protein
VFYFNSASGKVDFDVEPFSLKALVMSEGKTCLLSEATPVLFKSGQQVLLNEVYKRILDLFRTKLKYKKYFSTWIVVGSAWNIMKKRHYYEIRQGFDVCEWVTAEEIRNAGSQKEIAKGPYYIRQTPYPRRSFGWVSEQQSLDPDPESRWDAKAADAKLRERLRQARSKRYK